MIIVSVECGLSGFRYVDAYVPVHAPPPLNRRRRARVFLAALLACAHAACSGDGARIVPAAPPLAEPPAAPGPSELYVIATAISTDSGANTYVTLLDSLESQQLDLGRAREFAGWSDLGVMGDWVFVSSGETPEVSRFVVGADQSLQADGTVSFASYVGDANFYNQELISPTKAYLLGEGELVIWNPSTLQITGTLPYPELPTRDGILPYVALDRGAVVRDGRMYVTVTWTDTEQLNMLGDSRILVVDVENDAIVDVLTAPCPDLAVADRDEAGNLYFSNWVYSPGATLLYGDSPACMVRIPSGSDSLDAWSLRFSDVNGNEGAVLGYIGDGKWLFSSFLGDPDEFDAQTDDWFDWLFGDTWQLELLDPESGTSTTVSALPRNGGGYYATRFSGTTHVLIPGDNYATTSVHALGADGSVTHEIDTMGWATRLFRLR